MLVAPPRSRASRHPTPCPGGFRARLRHRDPSVLSVRFPCVGSGLRSPAPGHAACGERWCRGGFRAGLGRAPVPALASVTRTRFPPVPGLAPLPAFRSAPASHPTRPHARTGQSSRPLPRRSRALRLRRNGGVAGGGTALASALGRRRLAPAPVPASAVDPALARRRLLRLVGTRWCRGGRTAPEFAPARARPGHDRAAPAFGARPPTGHAARGGVRGRTYGGCCRPLTPPPPLPTAVPASPCPATPPAASPPAPAPPRSEIPSARAAPGSRCSPGRSTS